MSREDKGMIIFRCKFKKSRNVTGQYKVNILKYLSNIKHNNIRNKTPAN